MTARGSPYHTGQIHFSGTFHTRAGRDADTANVSKIDRFRREWETFFLKATDGRMRADTRLR